MSNYVYTAIGDNAETLFAATRKYDLVNFLRNTDIPREGMQLFRNRDGRSDTTVVLEFEDLVKQDVGEL